MTMLLAFVLLALLGPAHAAPQFRDLNLSRARLEGAVFHNGAIVPAQVFDMPEGDVLWAEAELPSQRRAPVVVADDAATSGGKYAVIPDQTFRGSTGGVTYSVHTQSAGAFRLWARTFWPDIGGNSFYLQLDDQEKQLWGNDEAPGHIGEWFWLEGPEWRLNEGLHRIAIWWREDGAQLDKIALGPPAFVPEGLGAPAATPRIATSMTVAFPPFTPPLVSKWLRAKVDITGKPPDLQLVAVDRDGNTTPLGPAGDMSALPVRDPKGSAVSLRAVITPSPNTAIRGARLEYDGEPSTFELTNGKLSITFDRSSGEVMRIARRDMKTEALLAPSGLPFRLQVWRHEDRELEWLQDSEVKLLEATREEDADGPMLRAKYRVGAPGGHCLVTCAISLNRDGGLSTWRIGVENHGAGFDIVEIEYPVIRNVAIGKDGADDWLTWPNWLGAGQLIPRPCERAPGRGTYCSGRGMMHWLDVYEKGEGGRGLYLASEDPTWLMGALRAEAKPGTGTVDIALSKMPRIRPGDGWSSQDFTCALHEGDWHAGADLYREWMDSQIEYDPPAWVVESDGWLGRGRGSNFLNDIPAHFRRAKGLGLNYVEFWGQMAVGLTAGESCCNRLYFPDPRYGTEADFTKAIGYVREAGGHIGFYTNGQAWNPRYPKLRPEYEGLMPEGVFIPDWEKEYHDYGLIQPGGSYVSQYAKPSPDDPYPGAFFLMCPATEGWPRYLHHYIVDKYVKQYGVDAMYIDQVGAAGAQWCFAENHLHEQVGAWTQGHMENFHRIKEDGRAHEPEFAIATEGFGDCYGRDVDIFLISPASCSKNPYAYPGLVRYTLPDRVCYDGFANGNVSQRPNEEVLNDVFLFGNRFDMFPRGEETMDHFKRLLYLRQEVGPLLYRGRYMDDVDLETSAPSIKARWWKLDPKQAEGVLITILNPEGLEGQTISVPFEGKEPARCYVADLEHKLVPAVCAQENGLVRVTAPTSPVSTALVVSRVNLNPPALLKVMTPVGAVGAPSEIIVRYRPIAPTEGEMAMALVDLPEGWSAQAAPFHTNEACDIAIQVTPPAGVQRRAYPITVKVKLPGGRVLSFPEKLLLHDAFSAKLDFDGERVTVALDSHATAPLAGTCTLSVPGWLELREREKRFEIDAKGTAEIVFPVSPVGKMTRAGRIEAHIKAGGASGSAILDITPPDISAKHWRPQRYEGEVTTRVENTGTPDEALVIDTKSRSDRGGWAWRSKVMVPGTKWTFSGEVRTEDMKSNDEGARIRIIFFHKSKYNKGTRPPIYTEFVTGTTDWRAFQTEFEVPKDTGAVQIELFNWHARGRSLWRNLMLR